MSTLTNSVINSRLAVVGSVVLLAFGFSTPSLAATYTSCSSTISGLVSGTQSCQISSEDQDKLNTTPTTVNLTPGFFNISTWLFGGKIGENTGYNGVGTGQSGTYDISTVFSNSWNDVMLVFKDGADTTLVGYQLIDNITSGTWSSPFRSPDFNVGTRIKDVSHISVYYSTAGGGGNNNGGGGNNSVPEPTQLALLAVGLIAMGASRLRKAKV